MVAEFEIAGNRYRFDGMPAQVETRILKRLAPLVAGAVPSVIISGSRLVIRKDADLVKVFQVVLGAWGRLSDDDQDAIERASLGALSRATGPDWHPVWPRGEAEPAFRDINGSVLLQLVGRSLGLVVKQWMEDGAESIPAEFRAVMQQLH